MSGFRTTGAIRNDPAGLPGPLVLRQLREHPHRRHVLAAAVQQHRHRAADGVHRGDRVGARRVRLRALRSSQAARRSSRCSRWACSSRPRSPSCRSTSCCARSGCSTTRSGVALPLAAFGIPLTIIILRPFFRSIPVELEDAAAIDGCSRFGFFWRIAAAAFASGPRHGGDPGPRRQPGMPSCCPCSCLADRVRVAAPAGRLQLLVPVLPGRGRDPRVHVAVDGAGTAVLRRSPSASSSAGSRPARSRDDAGQGGRMPGLVDRAGRRARRTPDRRPTATARCRRGAGSGPAGAHDARPRSSPSSAPCGFEASPTARLDPARRASDSPTASGRSRASPAPPTCRPSEVAAVRRTRSSASSSRRRASASRPSSTRRACTASGAATRPASRRRSGLAATLDPALVERGGAAHRAQTARRGRQPHARAGARRRARPALGPHRGDLRRGPVPGVRAWASRTCAASRADATRRDGASSPRASTSSATALPGGRPQPRPRCTSARASCTTCSCSPSRPRSATAGLGSVMHAYDDLDGVPCVASRELLDDHPARALGLRRHRRGRLLGHRAARDAVTTRSRDPRARRRMALEAGLDVELPAIDRLRRAAAEAIEARPRGRRARRPRRAARAAR